MIVHVITRKGMGYADGAEDDEAEQMHSTGVIDPKTGREDLRLRSAPGVSPTTVPAFVRSTMTTSETRPATHATIQAP
ncbi:hypothetical protein RA989_21720, partial [Mycobacteroides abscessus subsp. massiliense]